MYGIQKIFEGGGVHSNLLNMGKCYSNISFFSQNSFKYGRISLPMRKIIKCLVYPLGARIFKPLAPLRTEAVIFYKILSLTY